MELRYKRALTVCGVLLVAAVLLSLIFSGGDGSFRGTGGGYIVLSEVMASNRTHPAPNGQYLDYVEIRNLSDRAADISGYMLSDKTDAIGYTFPQGTILPAGGYAVCWCDKNDKTGAYAAFGISKDGTDTLYLYNSANVVVDKLDVPVMQTNVPLIRDHSGVWVKGEQGTPGFENSQAGYRAWLKTVDSSKLDVVISEVMTGSSVLVADDSGRVTDWVELWNRGPSPAVLDGAYLSDETDDLVKWKIPALTLQPGERRVIRCAGDAAGNGDATFSLSRDGCTVTLSGVMGDRLCQVTVPLVDRDVSWSLQADGTYAATAAPTPGFENTDAGHAAWRNAVGITDVQVVISEVMPANYSTVTNAAGQLCDWVELYNSGSAAAVLTGGYLSDDPGNRGKWQIPALTLQPGERTVICCSGASASEKEANFGLSRDGCTVLLTGSKGQLLCQVEVDAQDKDRAWALQPDGTYLSTQMATPGFENTQAGRQAYLTAQKPRGALVISEVMPANTGYYRQPDGEYYDWVELYNNSDQTIQLADYTLSDDPAAPDKFRLPQQSLAPGKFVIVICSGNTELGGGFIHANFTLGRDESWLYVADPDGQYSDYISVYDVPYGASVGRSDGAGTYYFTQPTPGSENRTGVVFISEAPAFVTQGGVFDGVSDVTVKLTGTNIRYTTDGSQPTASSPRYTGPLTLTQTAVVRAASFEEGKLRSDVITASFIINENHTLPVVSLTTEPEDLFGYNGLYVNYTTEREVPCHVSLFEEDGGFAIDCGLKMFGHMGLKLPKKSFKINFRGKYGQDYLTYPVYGADGPQLYDSLVIRSGQDYMNTIFRDELFTSLCREASDRVLAQRDKHCILYINGQYWGIYTIKEAFGVTMYAENYQVDEQTVTVQQAPVGPSSPVSQVIRFARTHDLSVQENYEQFAAMMDVDSMIDWMIFEGYAANTDIQQNLRYFKSTATGDKWQFAYYDLDWAWYFKNGFIGILSNQKDWQHIPMCQAAMKNGEFRKKFFTRMAQLREGVLSNEHVLSRIDHYVQLLSPEIQRDRARWGGSYAAWEKNVQRMKSYIQDRDHWAALIVHLQRFAGLTDQEYQTYFGGQD